jgi:hypothetical protein
MWVATGNNIVTDGEMVRRVYRIDLSHSPENPKRTEFKHPQLIPWIKENRERIVTALLTIAAGWVADGAPEPKIVPVLDSFEEWHKYVGGICEWMGATKFLSNLGEMAASLDEESQEWFEHLKVLHELLGPKKVTTSEIAACIRGTADEWGAQWINANPATKARLMESVIPAAGSVSDEQFAKKLGMAYSSRKERTFANGNGEVIKILKTGKNGVNQIVWSIVLTTS